MQTFTLFPLSGGILTLIYEMKKLQQDRSSVAESCVSATSPSSSPIDTALSLPGTGLSTNVIRAVETVNAIFHLINKDWGNKTSHIIEK